MSVRFRIRTSQGQEITFASHEMFAEFVQSGDLSPDDVVYDAETKEWSSALTHPVVLQIEMDSEDDADERAGGMEEETAAVQVDSSEGLAGSDIGLQLAPAIDQLTPAEAEAAFLKKMEAERASEFEFDDEPAIQGLKMEQGSSGFAGGVVETVEDRPPPRPEKRHEPRREEPRRQAPTRKEAKARAKIKAKAKVPKQERSGAGRRYAPLVIVGVVLVAGGVYLGPELLAPGEETLDAPIEDSPPLQAPPTPPPAPSIPDTEDALRGRAQERFLTTTRALLRDLPPIPDIWLQGAYLAAPSDYPQVREVWSVYLTTIRQTRAGDNERYRAGYLRALDDARVEASERTLRLAGAVSAFQGQVSGRAAHYDRVEAIAMAALRGHDALAAVEGTISYEPSSGSAVSGDRGFEAVGRNQDAQALLDQVLDMISSELDATNGPGQVANLSEWVWDGLLDAVTN